MKANFKKKSSLASAKPTQNGNTVSANSKSTNSTEAYSMKTKSTKKDSKSISTKSNNRVPNGKNSTSVESNSKSSSKRAKKSSNGIGFFANLCILLRESKAHHLFYTVLRILDQKRTRRAEYWIDFAEKIVIDGSLKVKEIKKLFTSDPIACKLTKFIYDMNNKKRYNRIVICKKPNFDYLKLCSKADSKTKAQCALFRSEYRIISNVDSYWQILLAEGDNSLYVYVFRKLDPRQRLR